MWNFSSWYDADSETVFSKMCPTCTIEHTINKLPFPSSTRKKGNVSQLILFEKAQKFRDSYTLEN